MVYDIRNHDPAGGRMLKEDSSVLNLANLLEMSMGVAPRAGAWIETIGRMAERIRLLATSMCCLLEFITRATR